MANTKAGNSLEILQPVVCNCVAPAVRCGRRGGEQAAACAETWSTFSAVSSAPGLDFSTRREGKVPMKTIGWVGFVGLVICALALAPSAAIADPLPGRDVLKFQQLPLDNLTYPVGDPIGGFVPRTFWGHNELSTAYGDPFAALPVYRGHFMADDFADRHATPVVHVRWWGSYPSFNPDFPVNKFLISFESDIPATPQPGGFSRPGQPLLNQIVTRGPLFPGSGTFTETPYSPGGPPLFEPVFQYNAELHLDKAFFQQPDTVYWLKIVALVDVPGVPFDPMNPPPFMTQWGWHDRDYTKTNPEASVQPAVVPGEYLDGFVPNTPGVRIYHFQDDAVTGGVVVELFSPTGGNSPIVIQDPLLMAPTNYLDDIDGPPGIRNFSKDLAFELFTVPEPGTMVLSLLGLVFVAARSKRTEMR